MHFFFTSHGLLHQQVCHIVGNQKGTGLQEQISTIKVFKMHHNNIYDFL